MGGGPKQSRSRGAIFVRTRVLPTTASKRTSPKRRRRSAGRRVVKSRATLSDVTIRGCCGRGARHTLRCRHLKVLSGALAFRRSVAALVAARSYRLGPGRASRDAESKALPPPCSALKPSTWLAGRNAGGDDARAARERFARPPAGTALAPLSRSHLESALRQARCFSSSSSLDA